MDLLTVEMWENLTDADRNVLISIGITAPKPKVKKLSSNPLRKIALMARRTTAPEEYYVKGICICMLCGTVTNFEGKMVKDIHRMKHLSFVKQSVPKNECFKQIKTEQRTCKNCERVLMLKDKEHLVKMLMEKQYARITD